MCVTTSYTHEPPLPFSIRCPQGERKRTSRAMSSENEKVTNYVPMYVCLYVGEYKPFNELTLNALHHAAAEHGVTVSPDAAEALMRSYDALHTFPEVPGALDLLNSHSHSRSDPTSPDPASTEAGEVEAYIFSNGTDAMVGNSVRTSPELASHLSPHHHHHHHTFKALITVDELRCYKPDPRVYKHLVERTGMMGPGREADVWVVSANPFDIVGARAAGLNAAFVDRSGRGWVDRLDGTREPTVVVGGVDEAVRAILDRS